MKPGNPALRLLCGLVAVCAFTLGANSAEAQSTDGFSTLQFNPSPTQSLNLFNVASARILGNAQWGVGLLADYADDPLLTASGGDRVGIVHSQLVLNPMASIGLGDRLEVGVAVPIVVYQSGENVPGFVDGSQAGAGLGDPRFALKVLLFNNDTSDSPGGAGLALLVDTFIPLGDPDAFQGDDGIRVHPRVAFDYGFAGGTTLSLNAGYMVRPEATLANLEVDDVITFGAGVGIPVGSVDVIVEAVGSASALGEDVAEEEIPVELLVGARYHADSGLNVTYGVGLGVLAGFGSPDWRAFLGFGSEKSGCTDCDDDGLINLQDECPNQAEDFDNFQDDDGCPELDNDGDGINDTDDECPFDPEDNDGFQDEDGCNDPDNDADGVLDGADRCPDSAEDMDGHQDDDGCDDVDNDGDNVLDVDDECPNDAEDVDGYADEDGCPEPDNDSDGLLDNEDSCPQEPEDFDGFEDADGCPEEGEGLVQLTCEQIEIQEAVRFSSGSDEIEGESYELLDQVAQVLTSASYLRSIRVEGHTDNRGSEGSNLDLSQRRAEAVREYLINAGVTQSIESRGFGEEMPIADNQERSGRRMNRRVEFHVVEQDSRCN